jgi:hypothetical protein
VHKLLCFYTGHLLPEGVLNMLNCKRMQFKKNSLPLIYCDTIMKKILGFFLLIAPSAYAGTPGNGDVWILYGIAIALFGIPLGIDALVRFIKRKRLEKLQALEVERMEETEPQI